MGKSRAVVAVVEPDEAVGVGVVGVGAAVGGVGGVGGGGADGAREDAGQVVPAAADQSTIDQSIIDQSIDQSTTQRRPRGERVRRSVRWAAARYAEIIREKSAGLAVG